MFVMMCHFLCTTSELVGGATAAFAALAAAFQHRHVLMLVTLHCHLHDDVTGAPFAVLLAQLHFVVPAFVQLSLHDVMQQEVLGVLDASHQTVCARHSATRQRRQRQP